MRIGSRPGWAGWGLIVLAAGIAASAILGPLVLGIIRFRVSAGAVTQLLGGEVVALLAAAPLALGAGTLWLRQHRIAPLLAFAPAAFALYMYPQYIIGPQYDRYAGNNELFFPLYLLLTLLGWLILVAAWRALHGLELPPPTTGLRRVIGTLVIVLNMMFAMAWIRGLVPVFGGGGPGLQEYQSDQSLFWVVRLMDLGFVIPAGLIAGSQLLRGSRMGSNLAYAFSGFQALLVTAVAGMAVLMAVKHDPASSSVMLVLTVVMSAALSAAWVLLLRHAMKHSPSRVPPATPHAGDSLLRT